MDSILVDHLRSGHAWVLVGSGPSVQMGYPSWQQLAEIAAETTRAEGRGQNQDRLKDALKNRDFPTVFEESKGILGGDRLRQCLQDGLRPSSAAGAIYDLITRWPVPVYLTTNFDDEIQRHLAKLGEAYTIYSNSQDHFRCMTSDLDGAIFKLHGDLRSDSGLILTSSEYREIATGENWKYWRETLQGAFQMQRVVVIGHSLTDPNIRHILEAAREGAGIQNPICWLAPDVSYQECKRWLEDYRVRVIPYDNRAGDHRNLLQLIDSITNFIPPRATIHIHQQLAQVSQSPLGPNAAAPGFFVFNKLAIQSNFEEKRVDVVVAAIEGTLSKLIGLGRFDLQKALALAGWPNNSPLSPDFAEKVVSESIQRGLLESTPRGLRVGKKAQAIAADSQTRFEHMRERFRSSLGVRLKRAFHGLSSSDIDTITSDIEASLTGYFRECGLTLTSALFSEGGARQSVIPDSILKYINAASARYDDLLRRQAFFTISLEAFVDAGPAERDYLGRISQGFFAFHALGIFGDAAIQRLKQAHETVWLVDSNIQIPTLAFAAPTNPVFRDTFKRLHDLGMRFFTIEKLFEETNDHLRFASSVIKENGADSPYVMAAAMGDAPYRKSNQFLEGFIRWQAAGNPCDWPAYLFQAFGNSDPTERDIKKVLTEIGVEVVRFQDWPGFSPRELSDRDECAEKIKIISLGSQPASSEQMIDLEKKAIPEAEASMVVKREREGVYYIMSAAGVKSLAWFISDTSILNLVGNGMRITWRPSAFLRYAATLSPAIATESANQAFETLLWEFAQTGITLLDEKIVSRVFGGIIDQARLNIVEQLQTHEKVLAEKYGESPESILKRMRLSGYPLASLQLSKEAAQAQARRAEIAEAASKEAELRAVSAEKAAGKLMKYKSRLMQKEWERQTRKRKRGKVKK